VRPQSGDPELSWDSSQSCDPEIVAGASGASGLAALNRILKTPALAALRDAARLGDSARVLLFNTEGATDPEHWNLVAG